MRKFVSAKPCPWACETRLMGTPSIDSARSVPWSASKPRRIEGEGPGRLGGGFVEAVPGRRRDPHAGDVSLGVDIELEADVALDLVAQGARRVGRARVIFQRGRRQLRRRGAGVRRGR